MNTEEINIKILENNKTIEDAAMVGMDSKLFSELLRDVERKNEELRRQLNN